MSTNSSFIEEVKDMERIDRYFNRILADKTKIMKDASKKNNRQRKVRNKHKKHKTEILNNFPTGVSLRINLNKKLIK